jgi:hypothetical protein
MLRSPGLIFATLTLFACKAGPSGSERSESPIRSGSESSDLVTLLISSTEEEVDNAKRTRIEMMFAEMEEEEEEEKDPIDDIFGRLHHRSQRHNRRKSQEKSTTPTSVPQQHSEVKSTRDRSSTGSHSLTRTAREKDQPQRRRYTEDGLPIYTVEELGIGKGGNTPLCPIDCDCCH